MQQTINERLKILIGALNISARAFSAQLEVPESNTRNYLDKSTKLNSDYLERIALHFKSVNLSWLITGEGSIFTGEVPQVTNTATTRIKKVSGGAVNSGTGNQVITLEGCQQELEQTKRTVADLQKENAFLRAQLDAKDALIASKEETLTVLKAAFNRPN